MKSLLRRCVPRFLTKNKLGKENSKTKPLLKEITQLLLAVEMKRESPKPLDTYSFPDWRWLAPDEPKTQWIQWTTEGVVGRYHLKMVHLCRGTVVTISQNDKTVMSYATDVIQMRGFSSGVQDLVYLESELPAILEDLKSILTQR
ncbi:hypothetical protein ACPFMY_000462 [Vibrio cholerae]